MHMMRLSRALARSAGDLWARSGGAKATASIKAATAQISAAKFRNLRSVIAMSYAYRYARAGRHGFSFRVQNNLRLAAGDKREDRAEHEHQAAQPDPMHQRIQVGVNHRRIVLGTAARIDNIKVASQRRVQGHNRLR